MERSICMVREKRSDGTKRFLRIPWDLVVVGDVSGFSPMPVAAGFDSKAQTAVYTPDIVDMLFDPDGDNLIDPVTDILWFESEADFSQRFDNVNAQYTTTDPSKEFGYPRT